jgi:hypothetical protein
VHEAQSARDAKGAVGGDTAPQHKSGGQEKANLEQGHDSKECVAPAKELLRRRGVEIVIQLDEQKNHEHTAQAGARKVGEDQGRVIALVEWLCKGKQLHVSDRDDECGDEPHERFRLRNEQQEASKCELVHLLDNLPPHERRPVRSETSRPQKLTELANVQDSVKPESPHL